MGQPRRIALVTGAGTGIGKAVSIALADAGWTVVLAGRRAAPLDDMVRELGRCGHDAAAIATDVCDPNAVRQIIRALKGRSEKIGLSRARVKRIEPLGTGERVCVDTCSSMALGEGMLVGNSSQGLFLIHSESVENPFVNTRPFRVNAGPVHAYVRFANGETKYLSEVQSGDQVLVVNFEGASYPAVVGRAKVEKRPLVLVEAEEKGEILSVILQNAETIRLTAPSGKAVSLVDLKVGDEVLVCREKAGRHFGVKIDETIVEK